MDAVIEVEHLQKRYGATVAVADVSLDVRRGEIFGVIGPNGAGKTTTIECLQGLRVADAGALRVLGLDPRTHAQELRGRIGAQLQQSALPDRLRVGEALALFAAFAPRPVDPGLLLEQWGLAALRGRAFGSLSGGQQQRLFVALAFVNQPELVFLDELTQGLDPQARRVTWDLIREVRARGTTVVLVTHFMDEAELLCDRVAIVDGGQVVALDTPQGLIASVGVPARVRFTLPPQETERDLDFLRALPVIQTVTSERGRVTVEGTGPALALVAAALVERGILPDDLRVERPTLEDAFIALTGRESRG